MSTPFEPTTKEQPVATATGRRRLSIGLPRCSDPAERRFPLTPEGAQMLVEQGFELHVEEHAAASIHYADAAYERAGVRVATRAEVLKTDIVISLSPLQAADVAMMRRGAMLLTLNCPARWDSTALKTLLRQGILTMGIDLIRDSRGNLPFADILAEIDGRAAMTRAASLLADSVHGKGILLGGVAGIVPCEVTVIGSGIAACAAARSAIGQGALVRMFDHDVYRLRRAERELGPGVVTSALHTRVLHNALRSADVVIYTGVSPMPRFDSDVVELMKRGVIVFDLTGDCGRAFPSLPPIDLALASPLDISLTEPSRACYVNAGNAVARTAAMALSNSFNTMLAKVVDCEGTTNAIRILPGLQCAVLTFMGKPANTAVAEATGCRQVDINIYLTLS